MVVYANECVDCGLPCLGESCPNRNVVRTFCDECGAQADTTEIYGKDLCDECAARFLDKEAELHDAAGF